MTTPKLRKRDLWWLYNKMLRDTSYFTGKGSHAEQDRYLRVIDAFIDVLEPPT